jgi:hypothetical protein
VLTLDWLPTRVSDTGGPSKGYLFLVAHTKGIWYWWPVNCHLLLVAHTRAIGGPGIFLRVLSQDDYCDNCQDLFVEPDDDDQDDDTTEAEWMAIQMDNLGL